MKIIHLHPDPRMAARFVQPLIIQELAQGWSSEIIVSLSRSDYNFRVIPYDICLANIALLPCSFFRLCFVFSRLAPDVVVSHNSKSSLLPLLAAFLTRIPVRVYFNHGVPFSAYSGILRFLLRALEFVNLSLATSVLTVSDDMRNILATVRSSVDVGLLASGSACGVDLDAFNSWKHRKAHWRSMSSFSETDLLVVFSGRPMRRKGFHLVLNLWNDYIRDARAKLILCGPTELDVVNVLGFVPSNVFPFGFVDEIPEILSSADLLILPSHHEGLSYACIEALACGILVAASDIPGIRSVIQNDYNGILVSVDDVLAYSKIIDELLVRRSKFVDISSAGPPSVLRFSQSIILSAYISHLKNLTSWR